MISGRDLRCHGHLSLVSSGDDLVAANGRVQATYSAAQVAGPLLAGVLITVAPVQQVLWVDAASFLASEGVLGLIATPFNAPGDTEGRRAIRQEVPGWVLDLTRVG